MIETKEQYDEMFRTRSYSSRLGRFVPGGFQVKQIEDCQETIEALREVARASEDIIMAGDEVEPDMAVRYISARKALPDWILEDDKPECVHEWHSMENEAISATAWCPRCGRTAPLSVLE